MLKPRILIVDDEERLVSTLCRRLTERELEVVGVYSGKEAIEEIRKRLYDVVILDVKMPGMDGMETLREIKKINPGIEVIMFTGHGSVDSAVEGMRSGAYDYILKPCDVEELIEKVDGAYKLKIDKDERIRRAEIRRIIDRRPT